MFDKDLMDKEATVPTEAFWDMVFEKVYCPLHAKCINAGWLLDLNNDGLKVYKIFYCSNPDFNDFKINIRLQFDTGLSGYPNVPQIIFAHQFGDWNVNFSDGNATRRWLNKKDPKHFNFIKGEFNDAKYFDMHFNCTTDTTEYILKLMKSMIEKIISKQYNDLIQKDIDTYVLRNKQVPGIIIDQSIMKKLIKEA